MMSENLQTLLPIVGGLVVFVILLNGLRAYFRQRREHHHEEVTKEECPKVAETAPITAPKKTEPADIFFISLHAKPGNTFGDDFFLQTLESVGLVFGDNQIFHYDVKTEEGDARLFSVAKLNKPGTFNIDDASSLSCRGLLFFMDKRDCKRLVLAFDYMLEVAKQLAEDLDGTLYEGYSLPWSDEKMRDFREALEQRSA